MKAASFSDPLQSLTARKRATSPPLRSGAAARWRTAIITGPRAVSIENVRPREPATGEVRIQLEGSGVCASNVPLWEGRRWFAYPGEPGAPGHEGWGIVDAVGDEVDDARVGDRVAVLACHSYASFDIAPAAHTVRIPERLDGVPFPGEPIGCAFNVFRRSGIEAGQTVAVVGIGFLGAILTRLAANAGARVIAISRREFSLEIAKEFGAVETVRLDEHSRVVGRVRDATGGRWCDRVIEAVGMQWPLDLAGELTAERGRLVIAGFHQDGPRQINLQLWNWRGIDVVNAHERDPAAYVEGMQAAVAALARGDLDPSPLYTHRFALDELDKALDAAAARPDGFLKALVCP